MVPRRRLPIDSKQKNDEPSLPAIPENTQSSTSYLEWDLNDDELEDGEEQRLYEKDNETTAKERGNNDNDKFEKDVVKSEASNHLSFAASKVTDEDEVHAVEPNSDSERLDPGPFYIQSTGSSNGEKWELTWPIWHMLPRSERRAIAEQHGMKSIGEFEEYMTLARAVDESETGALENTNGRATLLSGNLQRTENKFVNVTGADNITPMGETGVEGGAETFIFGKTAKSSEDDDSSVSSTEDEKQPASEIQTFCGKNKTEKDIDDHLNTILRGGLPCTLPDEILHKTFSYLSIDSHAGLALVSPHWSRFTRCESLYKKLCERVYLNQSKRKTLHVSKFGNSYRKMLEIRPRVRTGDGLYVLKYQEVRKIQRDMWTEIPVGAILESVYYRYLYFFEDGCVLYALTHVAPIEMIPRFVKMILGGRQSRDKWGVWGTYQLRKDNVKVWISHSWHDVMLELRVIPSNKMLQENYGERGMFTSLMLEKHLSSASGIFDENESHDLVKYEIPSHCCFRFLRDKRL